MNESFGSEDSYSQDLGVSQALMPQFFKESAKLGREVHFIGDGLSIEVTLLSSAHQDTVGLLLFNNKTIIIKFTIISIISS